MKFLIFPLAFIFSTLHCLAQGHDLAFTLTNFSGKEVYLGYHLGSKQYIADTAELTDGVFRFKGNKMLDPGIYMLVLPPKNDYFECLVDTKNQVFSMELDANDFVGSAKIKGSPENELYLGYMKFLLKKREERKPLAQKIDFHKNNPEATEYKNAEKGLADLDAEVKNFQRKLVKDHPKSMAAMLLNASLEPEMPERIEKISNEQERKLATYYYYKSVYLKGVNFADERLVRTPLLAQKIEYYLEKLTQPQPDSVIVSVDYILGLAKQNKEVYKYACSELLNKYARSKTICFDAVYVHIADKYYCDTKAPFGGATWVEKEAFQKICDNAAKLRPLLCNKTVPDVELALLPLLDAKKTKVSEVKANYTVLVLWKQDCATCAKMLSQLSEQYETLKSKGAEVLLIAVNQTEEAAVVEQKLKASNAKGIFALDTERAAQKAFNADVMPFIYLLDKDKKILYKRLDVKQVVEVVTTLSR